MWCCWLEILILCFIFRGYLEVSSIFGDDSEGIEKQGAPTFGVHPKWGRGHWSLIRLVARVDIPGAGEAGRFITGAFWDGRQGGWWGKPLGAAARYWWPSSFMLSAGGRTPEASV